MLKYSPEAGAERIRIHRDVNKLWDDDRWISIKKLFGITFTRHFFFELYFWVAYQPSQNKTHVLAECMKNARENFGEEFDP